MFPHRKPNPARAGTRPPTIAGAYGTPADGATVRRGVAGPPFDVDGAVVLALFALSSAPRVVVAVVRREVFAFEATACAFVLGFALVSLLRLVGPRLATRAARRRGAPRPPSPSAHPRQP